jgi:hypothetical protein
MVYTEVLNKYFRGDTLDLLKKNLKGISDLVNVVPWSPKNLVSYANKSTVSMIPINLSVPMQLLKPENRLLIMWRLGLPCLTSASPAYARVAAKAGVSVVCESMENWSESFSRILGDAEFARNQILKGQNYLRENHNREILLQKWDLVFESVLD